MLVLYIICSFFVFIYFFHGFSKEFSTPASEKVLSLLQAKWENLISNRLNASLEKDLNSLNKHFKRLSIAILAISFVFSMLGLKSTLLGFTFVFTTLILGAINMRKPKKNIIENIKSYLFLVISPIAFYFFMKYGNPNFNHSIYLYLATSLFLLLISILSVVILSILEGILLLILMGLLWTSIKVTQCYKSAPVNYKKNIYYLTVIFSTLTLIFLGCNPSENKDFKILEQQKTIDSLEQQLKKCDNWVNLLEQKDSI